MTQENKADSASAITRLTLSDVAMARGLIEIAVQRGAFKVTELRKVQDTYEKLDSFLATVAQQQQNVQEETKEI